VTSVHGYAKDEGQWCICQSLVMSQIRVKCTVLYVSECVVMFQIQNQMHSGIFTEFDNVSKSEPNAQLYIYRIC